MPPDHHRVSLGGTLEGDQPNTNTINNRGGGGRGWKEPYKIPSTTPQFPKENKGKEAKGGEPGKKRPRDN